MGLARQEEIIHQREPIGMKAGKHHSSVFPSMLVGISLVLALGVLVIDLAMPSGVAAGAPYIALVLTGYFVPWRYYIYLMAGLATLLTIISFYALPVSEVTGVVLANHGLTLIVIWAAAVIGVLMQKNEAKYRTAINNISDGIIVTDALGVIESFNKGAETIFGYFPEEIIGSNVSILMPSPQHEGQDAYISHYLKTNNETNIPGKAIETKAQHKDGTIIPIELTVTESHDMGRLSYTAIMRNISERVHAAEQLNKLSCAINQSPVSVMITDIKGKIEYVNPKFTQASGYDYDEVIGQNPRFLKSGETPSEEYSRLWETVSTGGQWRGMFHNVKKNGELYWESANISPIRNYDGEITHFLAVKEDITERLGTENQLAHALKIEAAGQLASGIVHDFNNLLTIITGNLQLLLAGMDHIQGKEINAILADALSASEDSGELIKRLLVLSRKESPRAHEININEFILDNARFLDRMLGEHIKIRTDLAIDIGAIVADHSQLESALLNLAANSRDAMPDGGIFTIQTARISVSPGYHASIKELKPGSYIALTVTDTGTGMDQAVLQQACEPFFTTKASGKGSGLGLNMVYSFINQSGGDLDISSAPGTGTTITLFFPEAVDKIDGRKT